MVVVGMEDYVILCELFGEKLVLKVIFVFGFEIKESLAEYCFNFIVEYVKVILECVFRVKNCII